MHPEDDKPLSSLGGDTANPHALDLNTGDIIDVSSLQPPEGTSEAQVVRPHTDGAWRFKSSPGTATTNRCCFRNLPTTPRSTLGHYWWNMTDKSIQQNKDDAEEARQYAEDGKAGRINPMACLYPDLDREMEDEFRADVARLEKEEEEKDE